MDFKEFIVSKPVKIIACVLGALVLAALIFHAGFAMGSRWALHRDFHERRAEEYRRAIAELEKKSGDEGQE